MLHENAENAQVLQLPFISAAASIIKVYPESITSAYLKFYALGVFDECALLVYDVEF